jgi:deazaflavin-dependent oxidoreductase (nitroreductase family)
MPKVYRTTPIVRFFNSIMKVLIRLGFMPQPMHVLTVRGRKSGKLYKTPVSLIIHDDKRYLVSPYGEVNWVKNARTSGAVTLAHGRKQETYHIQELAPTDAAPILKEYMNRETITQPYFNVTSQSPVEAFEAEAAAHPVFELVSTSS